MTRGKGRRPFRRTVPTNPIHAVETDRFIVLLECGHWTQTRQPYDVTWHCSEGHSWQAPAKDNEGRRMLFSDWIVYE